MWKREIWPNFNSAKPHNIPTLVGSKKADEALEIKYWVLVTLGKLRTYVSQCNCASGRSSLNDVNCHFPSMALLQRAGDLLASQSKSRASAKLSARALTSWKTKFHSFLSPTYRHLCAIFHHKGHIRLIVIVWVYQVKDESRVSFWSYSVLKFQSQLGGTAQRKESNSNCTISSESEVEERSTINGEVIATSWVTQISSS